MRKKNICNNHWKFGTCLQVIIVVCVIFAGAFEVDVSNWSPFAPNGFNAVLTGATVVFFAYVGFDAVANSAEESKSPRVYETNLLPSMFDWHNRINLLSSNSSISFGSSKAG